MSNSISIDDFDYNLPEESIAQYPLKDRDASKLLVYQDGVISHRSFTQISEYVDDQDLIVFNNTKVIPARMFFAKTTGSIVQVFLLAPLSPFNQMERALASNDAQEWECIIGNLKKWKDNEILTIKLEDGSELSAELVDRIDRRVRLSWNTDISFSEILKNVGNIPLPPYIHRDAEITDEMRYQTTYALHDGAVAAPTAGLHFSEEVLDQLQNKGVSTTELTLHVGAGTFQPVKDENVRDHPMHEEVFLIKKNTLIELINASSIIATGTTSLRALESMYWMATKLQASDPNPFRLGQFDHENIDTNLDYPNALKLILKFMEEKRIEQLEARTAIMISPGYKVKSIRALITNFHMPKSTLIMLVDALIGDKWREIYQEALRNNYRFLSYGDSSLLMLE